MTFVKADRVQESSVTVGTGAIVLAGAYDASYRTFASQMTNGDTCQVLIISEAAAEWEIDEATFVVSGQTYSLSRTTILSSSNNNQTVNFSSGRKRVAMLPPASAMVVEDNSGNAEIANNLTVGGNLTIAGTASFLPTTYQQALLDRAIRPTGGGVGVMSQVATGGYTHFARTDLGLNSRIHTVYYHGLSHGQDDSEGVCQYQPGYTSVGLTIDGNYASGGTVTLAAPTRVSLTSNYDLSYMTFTVYGTINGVPGQSVTVTGPNQGRVFTPSSQTFSLITGITPSADTVGDVASGLYTTPANVETKYTDDGGKTWSNPYDLIDGLTTGLQRGYQTALTVSKTGTITVFVYKTVIQTNVSSTVRFVSTDNGLTWGPEQTVTFTGLSGTDTRITLYSKWRQLGDGTFVSVGSNGENSYWCQTTDGSVINCTLFAVTDYAAANTRSWVITGINDGTNTVTVSSAEGDVRDFFPADMATTIAGAGAANGNSYVVSTGWDGTNTTIVLNELVAGTIGASSRIRQRYGPAQILSANTGTNSLTLMYDQRANFIAGHFFGVSGSSGGGLQNADGFHKITSVSYDAPSNRTTLVLEDILDGATVGTTCRTTNVVLGEWGFDCLTDVTWAACPRTNGQVSNIPLFVTNNKGSTWSYMGQTNAPEGSYVSMTLDFVPSGGDIYTVIGGFRRSGIDKFFMISANSEDLLVTPTTYSDIYYWLTAGGTTNSGYPSTVVMGNTMVITYGIETSESEANIQARRVPLAPLLNPVAASAPTQTSGRYYGNYMSGAATSQVITENRLYFVLVPAPLKFTNIDQLAIYVSSATGVNAGSEIRLGAYADNGGKPDGGALLFDAGVVSMNAGTGLFDVTVDEVVGPRQWWIAAIGNLNGAGGSMPGIRASATAGFMSGQIGNTTGNYNSFTRYLYNNQTVSSWGTYTLPLLGPVTTLESSNNMIQLLYRKA